MLIFQDFDGTSYETVGSNVRKNVTGKVSVYKKSDITIKKCTLPSENTFFTIELIIVRE